MTTVIASPRRLPLFGIGSAIAAIRGIAHRYRAARQQRAASAQLANLTDRLRQDIGLADSSPIPADLLERFYRSRQTPPREHESRFKLWT
jgi:hypothetical protein